MSGTPNPALNIRELNGNLSTVADTQEGTILKIGVASAYIVGKPVVMRELATVNRLGVGPLASDSGPHIANCNRTVYGFQVLAAEPGTFGSVVKRPAGSAPSPSVLSLAAATFDGLAAAPDPIPGGAAVDRQGGFATPPSPLPLTSTHGAGTVAHVAVVDYLDEAGQARQAAYAVNGPGTFGTAAGERVKAMVRYRTQTSGGAPVDPVGTTALSFEYAGPLDRFDHLRFQSTRGGQITVSGAQQPQVRWSADDGVTWSPAFTIPQLGELDLYTHPGGFTRWHTGIRATFAQGTVAKTLYGAYRAAGATVNGDTVWTFATAGASIEVDVPTTDNATPSFGVVGSAVTFTTATSGAVAASYAGFGGNLAGLTFASATAGAGGNSITVAFVEDGTDAVSVIGNAITVHYDDGVTTVANVKAHFPVSTTFGSVTATGGTNGNVLAAPGDTHGATPLAGGVDAAATTTGAAAKAFFETDVSAGTLAARLLVNAVDTVGTGLGLVASAGPGLAPNGGTLWTAKKPGVRVRQVASGQSTAAGITAAGLDVTVTLATDTNGAQTSTPNDLVTLYGTAPASVLALVTAPTVTGTGLGIAGAWDEFVSLPVAERRETSGRATRRRRASTWRDSPPRSRR